MSLNFGFGYTENDGRWTELFQGMTKLDKQFFHQCLPFVCMGTAVGKVCEKTIPHIIAREDLNAALHQGPMHATTRSHLTLVQLAAEFGEEAAEKFQAAQDQAMKILAEGLPKGFTPDPVKTLRRFIGFHTNVRTETTLQFLSGLTDRRMTPMPHVTQKEIMRIEADAAKEHKLISSGAMKHPGLEVETEETACLPK